MQARCAWVLGALAIAVTPAAGQPRPRAPRELRIRGVEGTVRVAGWDRTGKALGVLGAGQFFRFDPQSGKVRSSWRPPRGQVIQGLSADWRRAATLDRAGRLRVWDLPGRRVLRSFSGLRGCSDVSWSPSGREVAVALPGPSTPGKAAVNGYRLRPNSRHRIVILGVEGSAARRVLRHVSADGAVMGHGFEGFTTAWSPDGRYLASALLSGSLLRDSPLHIWGARTGKRVRRLGALRQWLWDDNIDEVVAAPAWRPDGKVIAASWRGGREAVEEAVRLWDPFSGRALRSLPTEEAVEEIAWSRDGRFLAARSFADYWGDFTSQTARLWIWDASSGRSVLRVSQRGTALMGLAWRPDGRALAAGGSDGVVRVWEVWRGR